MRFAGEQHAEGPPVGGVVLTKITLEYECRCAAGAGESCLRFRSHHRPGTVCATNRALEQIPGRLPERSRASKLGAASTERRQIGGRCLGWSARPGAALLASRRVQEVGLMRKSTLRAC
jgi:hypothetical protein